MKFEIDVPEKVEICNLGHRHIIELARYKIPNADEQSSINYCDDCICDVYDDGQYCCGCPHKT